MIKKTLKIGLYCGLWPINIGNAFFEYGVKATLRLAYPDCEIYHIGGTTHWLINRAASHYDINNLKGNSFEIGEVADVDIIVFAGMSMCKEFVDNNGISFVKAAKRGVATLLLGTGAAFYTEDEANYYADFLNSLSRYAVITIDDDTFNLFKDKLRNISTGIDSAFFLPEYYTPPRLELPAYDVVNFDSVETPPQISHSADHIIYTHHNILDIKQNHINKPNTLISGVPEDYLALYSQVNEAHSDRVHACVATLAYRNKARLYNNTPRKSLFSKLQVDKITEQVVSLDMDLLNQLKKEQVNQVRILIRELLS